MRALKKLLTRFGPRREGVAAVEFAIISVVLAGLVIGMMEGWQFAAAQNSAQNAAGAAAVYYMQGGVNDTAAHDFALASWQNKPVDATVAIQRNCDCAGTSWACSTLCSGGLLSPRIQISITAYANYQDGIVSAPVSATEVVRVR